MKKKNHPSTEKKKTPLNCVFYMRVGSIEQLSLEEQKKHLDLKAKSIEKGGKP
jgi:hypothetical protein